MLEIARTSYVRPIAVPIWELCNCVGELWLASCSSVAYKEPVLEVKRSSDGHYGKISGTDLLNPFWLQVEDETTSK